MDRDIVAKLRSIPEPSRLAHTAAAEIEALRASVARLTAERDAAVAHIRKWERWWADRPSVAATTEYTIRGGARPAHVDPPPPWDAPEGGAGTYCHETLR